jgi:hypothetical protein
MPCRSTPFNALALGCVLLFAGASQAAPKPLSDAEMSAVRGADGSILAGVRTASSTAPNPLNGGLNAAFSSSTGAALLTPAQFAAALDGIDLAPAMLADYAGQPVAQTVVDARPATFSFDVADVLQSTTGLQFNGSAPGPSMGTLTLRDFDARGTTIWVWHR